MAISNLLSRIKLCYRYNIVHSFYQPLLGGAAFIQSKVQNSMFEELRKEKVKNVRQSKHCEQVLLKLSNGEVKRRQVILAK